MGTLGLVSIVKKEKVIFKCVAGSNGHKAHMLVEEIKKIEINEISKTILHNLCKLVDFGSIDDLVIQSIHDKTNRNLNNLYNDKKKFKDPHFNPRWKCGLSDHVEIIKY